MKSCVSRKTDIANFKYFFMRFGGQGKWEALASRRDRPSYQWLGDVLGGVDVNALNSDCPDHLTVESGNVHFPAGDWESLESTKAVQSRGFLFKIAMACFLVLRQVLIHTFYHRK